MIRKDKLRRVVALVACAVLAGCARRHVSSVVIPARCAQVKITDFTKPCVTLASGDLMCDQVRVHVLCVQRGEAMWGGDIAPEPYDNSLYGTESDLGIKQQ